MYLGRILKEMNPIYDVSDVAELGLAIFYVIVCLGAMGIGVWFIVGFADLLGVWRHAIGSVFILFGTGLLLGIAPRSGV